MELIIFVNSFLYVDYWWKYSHEWIITHSDGGRMVKVGIIGATGYAGRCV